MITIAVSIDQTMVAAIDRIARRGGRRRQRSEIVRQALTEFLGRRAQEAQEERERAALARHRILLARQARALVAEQAKA